MKRKDLVYGQRICWLLTIKKAVVAINFKKNTYVTHNKKVVENAWLE